MAALQDCVSSPSAVQEHKIQREPPSTIILKCVCVSNERQSEITVVNHRTDIFSNLVHSFFFPTPPPFVINGFKWDVFNIRESAGFWSLGFSNACLRVRRALKSCCLFYQTVEIQEVKVGFSRWHADSPKAQSLITVVMPCSG